MLFPTVQQQQFNCLICQAHSYEQVILADTQRAHGTTRGFCIVISIGNQIIAEKPDLHSLIEKAATFNMLLEQ